MIKVCGNNYNILGGYRNNPISFPMNSQLDGPSILSYHDFNTYSIVITRNGSLKAIGNNYSGEIYGSLPRQQLTNYTEFQIQDRQGTVYSPISALVAYTGSFFIVADPNNSEKKLLAYYLNSNNDAYPRFIDFGDRNHIALFGCGCAVIDSEGAIIFIDYGYYNMCLGEYCYIFKNSIEPVSLPNQEKAIKITNFNYSFGVYALSSTGKVYHFPICENLLSSPRFFSFPELEGINFVDISSGGQHLLALSDDGRVFGFGSNEQGQLGVGKEIKKALYCMEIKTLSQYNICAISAGMDHSLFKTTDGKILACGSNKFGQLILNSGASNECFYLPVETSINSNAKYMIADNGYSIVFIDCDPINSPNRVIKNDEINTSIEEVNHRNDQLQ